MKDLLFDFDPESVEYIADTLMGCIEAYRHDEVTKTELREVVLEGLTKCRKGEQLELLMYRDDTSLRRFRLRKVETYSLDDYKSRNQNS